jgi:regulator of PEP synthase PpsR (kinase-PPPase family)
MKRTAFFVSDGTGITAEALGQSLLAQFEKIDFERVTLPYTDSVEKAYAAVVRINRAFELDGHKPIIFDTIVNGVVRAEIRKSKGYMIDIFGTFLEPLEQELGSKSTYTVGKSHSIASKASYDKRIDAMNFALDNDDGARTRYYDDADIILIGVSRSGKTPTCIYLALQYGIRAANFPITEDELLDQRLPEVLRPQKKKLFGLTIDPERLAIIRNERKPNSKYCSMKQCNYEVEEVELMYRRERIPFLNSTDYSVEEISTRIMMMTGIERKIR